jgi:hypothetical protein
VAKERLLMLGPRTAVLRFETDTRDAYRATITIVRAPAGVIYDDGPAPIAADLPEDIIEALTKWIAETN